MAKERDRMGSAMAESGEAAAQGVWPPVGWVTKAGAARMLGVSAATLDGPHWIRRLHSAKSVRRPDGGRCNIYPVPDVERAAAERAAELTAAPAVPEGFVDRDG